MKRRTPLQAALISYLLLVGMLGLAAAGISWTVEQVNFAGGGPAARVYTAAITADDTGAAVGTVTMAGHVDRAVTVPDITSTNVTPLAAWDCALQDRDGVDVMGGALNDRINTVNQGARPYTVGTLYPWAPLVGGTVRLSCSAMGTTKKATARFYLYECQSCHSPAAPAWQ